MEDQEFMRISMNSPDDDNDGVEDDFLDNNIDFIGPDELLDNGFDVDDLGEVEQIDEIDESFEEPEIETTILDSQVVDVNGENLNTISGYVPKRPSVKIGQKESSKDSVEDELFGDFDYISENEWKKEMDLSFLQKDKEEIVKPAHEEDVSETTISIEKEEDEKAEKVADKEIGEVSDDDFDEIPIVDEEMEEITIIDDKDDDDEELIETPEIIDSKEPYEVDSSIKDVELIEEINISEIIGEHVDTDELPDDIDFLETSVSKSISSKSEEKIAEEELIEDEDEAEEVKEIIISSDEEVLEELVKEDMKAIEDDTLFQDEELEIEDDDFDEIDIEEDDEEDYLLVDEDDKTKKVRQIAANVDSDEIIEIFKYIDNLFGYLPEEKIKEFAKSKYYDLYNKIFDELDI